MLEPVLNENYLDTFHITENRIFRHRRASISDFFATESIPKCYE